MQSIEKNEYEIGLIKDELFACDDLNMIDFFKFIDVNGDNMVSVKELYDWVKKNVDKDMTMEKAELFMHRYDKGDE